VRKTEIQQWPSGRFASDPNRTYDKIMQRLCARDPRSSHLGGAHAATPGCTLRDIVELLRAHPRAIEALFVS